MIIGIMGRAGSGKTYVQNTVMHLFDDVLDLDQLGHQLLENETIKEKLQKIFGLEIMNNGGISREKLGKIVFSCSQQLKKLNHCIHPMMKLEVQEWIKKTRKGLIVGALIYQMKLEYLCDFIITIDSTTNQIIKKQPLYKRILQHQESRQWYNSHSDFVLTNSWNKSFQLACLKKITQIIN